MVTTKLNLSMTEPQVRQIYAKQGDTGRVLDITLDQTPEDGTLRILRPDGTEVTSEAVTGGEISESGETVTFESLTEADVTELTVGIEPVQDLNGQDNPYPAGGGVNKLTTVPTYSTSTVQLCLDLGSDQTKNVTFSFLATSASAEATNGAFLDYRQEDGTHHYITIASFRNESNTSFNTPGTQYSGRFRHTYTNITFRYVYVYYVSNSYNKFTSDALSEFQLEFSSSYTEYHPISNICPITGHDEVEVYFGAEQGTADETYTTSLGQTVYGGTLDMVSGVLTVDKAMVDLGSLTWLLNSSLNGKPAFYVRLDDAKTVSASSVADMTTSCYSVISADNLYIQKDNTGIIALNGQNYLQVRDTRYSTASAYKSGITGQTLVYELATPQTYTLTAQQIKTLVGTNNVWASSGDIVNITFTYGGLLSELPSEATEIVGKCYCDIEQNGVSSMPFTLNVKKNERES